MQRNGHSFSQNDLFQPYDLDKFKFKKDAGTAREMRKRYKCSSNKFLVAQIFWSFIKLVMEDLVRGGTTFHLPSKNISMFTWKRIEGEEFVKSYRSGKFKNVDFLSTNFTLYVPIFKYFYGGKFKERDIVISPSLREERDEKINNGFKYC